MRALEGAHTQCICKSFPSLSSCVLPYCGEDVGKALWQVSSTLLAPELPFTTARQQVPGNTVLPGLATHISCLTQDHGTLRNNRGRSEVEGILVSCFCTELSGQAG